MVRHFALLVLSMTSLLINAQQNVGIGILNPHPSAILDLTSTSKGLLVPRMDSLQRLAIATPANGLVVYDVNYQCLYYYKGNTWQSLCNTRFDSIKVTIATFDTILSSYAQFDTLLASFVRFDSLFVHFARFDTLFSQWAYFDSLFSSFASFDTLYVSYARFDTLFAFFANIDTLYSNIIYTDSIVINGQPLQSIINNSINNVINSTAWKLTGNAGTNPVNNFLGTTDNQALVLRTNNTERLRISSTGDVGIGTAFPAARLDVSGNIQVSGLGGPGTALVIANTTGMLSRLAFPGNNNEVLTGAGNFVNINSLVSNSWLLTGNAGTSPATHFIGTSDNQSLVIRTSNTERIRVAAAGNVGIGTNNPTALLHLNGNAGLFNLEGTNHAYIQYYPLGISNGRRAWVGFGTSGTPHFTITNETVNGDIQLVTSGTGGVVVSSLGNGMVKSVSGRLQNAVAGTDYQEPIIAGAGLSFSGNTLNSLWTASGANIYNNNSGNVAIGSTNPGVFKLHVSGQVYVEQGMQFRCLSCGSTSSLTTSGSDWGNLTIQGRVISANSNIHLSPPGGNKVIINSSYRAAGGNTGTTGLDIEDGGIRMRKSYMYFQRYLYCGNCYGAGSASYDLGTWDFCAVAHVGFKNNNSNIDEDDDVQCAVYPSGFGYGEQTNYGTAGSVSFTEPYNSKRRWFMYFEAFEDTNGVTCAANCINFE